MLSYYLAFIGLTFWGNLAFVENFLRLTFMCKRRFGSLSTDMNRLAGSFYSRRRQCSTELNIYIEQTPWITESQHTHIHLCDAETTLAHIKHRHQSEIISDVHSVIQ